HLLAARSGTALDGLSHYLTQPRGRALVRLGLQATGQQGALHYDGEVALQQAGFHAPAWNVDVTDLSGSVQLSRETLNTDALTLQVGQSRLKVQGSVHDYLAPRPSADLHLAFTAARDQDVAPFLPPGILLPQEGTLSGEVGVTLPPSGGELQTSGKVALSRIHLEPLDFLQPIEVVEGDLTWQGQNGTFTVQQGRLPGGDFSGHGQFHSFTPLNIEVSADFADLNLESALALNKPKAEDSGPKDTTVVVRADLTCGRFTYKTVRAEDLHLSCHWHGRQADLSIPKAEIEGGTLQGEAVLWPADDALFIVPQLTNVDFSRFFRALGTPTDVLTGTLSGKGKIYMPDWHQWDNPARWDATLSLAVANGVAQRLPILVRLWSALSLQGLLSFQFPSLQNEGLAFSSLTGDFALGKGLAVTKNLSLKSSAVQIDVRGETDLAQRTMDLKTALVPLYGITSSVAKVPLAGELLARGADLLTTLTFRINGRYDDPTVTPLLVDMGER
ncbi:MAG: AsmA-like C-terminal region-containing protein, partial [Deltaproteobacteria bacterium]|nr:AsmA-like C-terminal region-containing protein [Deltaproteobacteria bacterium]